MSDDNHEDLAPGQFLGIIAGQYWYYYSSDKNVNKNTLENVVHKCRKTMERNPAVSAASAASAAVAAALAAKNAAEAALVVATAS